MKIAFGIIVFESDFVLKQCLDQIYPFASQILIAEGPVKYWKDRGYTTSSDLTNHVLDTYPDPEQKITIVRGTYKEKTDQSNAYIPYLKKDTDYLWMVDADEIYKIKDIEKTIDYLEKQSPEMVSIKLITFYGGFKHFLTGFEQRFDCRRIFKTTPGCRWKDHRPPCLEHKTKVSGKVVTGDEFTKQTGVYIYHYSYVFPNQVYRKLQYYKAAVSKSNCIDNYFETIYLPWVMGDAEIKQSIEQTYLGVHEFKPEARGDCYTENYTGTHPESIEKSMVDLVFRLNGELTLYTKQNPSSYGNLVDSWKNQDVFQDQLELNLKEFNSPKWPNHWHTFLDFINKIKAKSILDVGCGSGIFSAICKPLRYVGLDYSQEAIRIATRANSFESSKFFVYDLWSLTEEIVSGFDVIHLGAVLDVLPNGHQALDFIASLRPKAIILTRVELTDKQSHFYVYKAYNKIDTYRFYHNRKEVYDLLSDYTVTMNGNNLLAVLK